MSVKTISYWLFRASVGLLVALLIVAALEGVARLAMGAPPSRLRFATAWSGSTVFSSEGELMSPVFQEQYAIAPFTRSPAPGTRRIIALGGSSVHAGSMIAPADEFPGRVGALLSTPDAPVEVINLGRPAVDSGSMVRVVEGLAQEGVRADVALIYLGHNDLGNLTQEAAWTPSSARAARLGAVLDRFRLTHLMRRSAFALMPKNKSDSHRSRLPQLTDAQRDQAKTKLRANLMEVISGLQGLGMAVAVVPAVGDIETYGPLGLDCADVLPQGAAEVAMIRVRYYPRRINMAQAHAALQRSPGCAAALHLRGLVRIRSGDAGGYDDLWQALDNDPVVMRATSSVQQVIRESALAAGATVIDLPSYVRQLRGAAPPEWFIDEAHFRPQGHDAVARVIAPQLAPLLPGPI